MKRLLLPFLILSLTFSAFAGQDFPTSADSDSLPDHLDDLETRTDTLRSTFSGSTAPSSPVTGQLFHDTDDDSISVWTGSAWTVVATAGGAAGSGGFTVYNNSGSDIPALSVVYYSGYNNGSSMMEVTEADSPGNSPLGVTTAAITNGTSGSIKYYGELSWTGFDTSSVTLTNIVPVYFDGSADATLTNTGSQQIGFVVKAANPGVVFLSIFALTPETVYKGAEGIVSNESGGTVTGGRMVRVTGVDSRGYPLVSAISAVTQKAVFYIAADIGDDERGLGTFFGAKATSLNTSGAAIGDPVYFTSTGALSLSATSNDSVGTVASLAASGVVLFDTTGSASGGRETFTSIGASDGTTLSIAPNTNLFVDNGENVYVAPSGDGSIYFGADGVGNEAGATIVINPPSGAGFGGMRIGAADFVVDTDTIFVDASTNRVGINDATPSVALDVTGAINATGAIQTGGTTRISSVGAITGSSVTASDTASASFSITNISAVSQGAREQNTKHRHWNASGVTIGATLAVESGGSGSVADSANVELYNQNSTAGPAIVGVNSASSSNGAVADIVVFGRTLLTCTGAVAVGDALYINSSGQGVSANSAYLSTQSFDPSNLSEITTDRVWLIGHAEQSQASGTNALMVFVNPCVIHSVGLVE